MTNTTTPSTGPRSLTDKTARGFVFMFTQTVGLQFVNLAGFVILGWLLIEEDFGLFALTTTIRGVAALIQQVGFRAILIQRQKEFERWGNPAFWMALALGLASSMIMFLGAPLGRLVYDEPRLPGLIMILALAMPFISVSAVAEAKLEAEMRFKLLASIQFIWTAGIMVFTVILAALDFGAYSFVIPIPFMQACRLAAAWWFARPRICFSLQFHEWRYLVGDMAMLTTSNAANFVTSQCDYVILGIFHTDAVVGIYFFGYSISQRAFTVLTNSLQRVLLPALSKLHHDPTRQAAAFYRAAGLLATIGIPICLLQVAMAGPLFDAFLPQRWASAVPVLQILSLGTMFRLVGYPALALINAQNRFPVNAALSLTLSALFITVVWFGAANGSALLVATTVSAFLILSSLVQLHVALRPEGYGLRHLTRLFVVPLSAGIGSVGGSWLLSNAIPANAAQSWLQLICIPLVGVPLYLLSIRRLQPTIWSDLMLRLSNLRSTDRSRIDSESLSQ